MKDNSLTSSGICKIIRACAQSGVRRLSYEGMEVEFFSSEKDIVEPEAGQVMPISEILPDEYKGSFQEESETLQLEDELDHLLVSNPSAYEELVAHGELDD